MTTSPGYIPDMPTDSSVGIVPGLGIDQYRSVYILVLVVGLGRARHVGRASDWPQIQKSSQYERLDVYDQIWPVFSNPFAQGLGHYIDYRSRRVSVWL